MSAVELHVGRERCALQARSSGSTTPRVTASSSAKAAVTSSSTTRPSRAPVSGRSRKVRRWNSRLLTARRAHRQATSQKPDRFHAGARIRRAPAQFPPLLGRYALQTSRSKVYLAVPDGDPKCDFGTAALFQALHLIFHELGKLVERYGVLASFTPRIGQPVVELV